MRSYCPEESTPRAASNSFARESERTRCPAIASGPWQMVSAARSIAALSSFNSFPNTASYLSIASSHGCIDMPAMPSAVECARSRSALPSSSPMMVRICFSVSFPAERIASHEDTAAPRAPTKTYAYPAIRLHESTASSDRNPLATPQYEKRRFDMPGSADDILLIRGPISCRTSRVPARVQTEERTPSSSVTWALACSPRRRSTSSHRFITAGSSTSTVHRPDSSSSVCLRQFSTWRA
mmetsp:Transcript_36448/g.86279  ORF Transcript_36448/g.86279 Transcript_36448/m.86279 type:complete len:239 (-) Transcript_36448:1715-2431(-)